MICEVGWKLFKEPPAKQKTEKDWNDFLLAKVKESRLHKRLEEADKVEWDATTSTTDASIFIKKMLSVVYGNRSGRLSEKQIEALGWMLSEWQRAIDQKALKLAEFYENEFKDLYGTFTIGLAIDPGDIGDDIASPPMEWFLGKVPGWGKHSKLSD